MLTDRPLASPEPNDLLALLPAKVQRAVLAQADPVELVLGEALAHAGQPTAFVYFPVNAFVSLIASQEPTEATSSLQEHALDVEVGMIGREGMLGVEAVLGVTTSPLRALVQGAGLALRMDRQVFAELLTQHEPLRSHLLRYVYVLMAQQATAANCLRHHLIGPRLARWLLMSQDRAQASHFHLTQEFLAHMLGVRRVGVTAAAVTLQRSGLISYSRGELLVLDRPGLEHAACSCYGADQHTYRAVLSSGKANMK